MICPNIKFTEEGYNISDKFRFAINKVKQNEIEQNLQKYLKSLWNVIILKKSKINGKKSGTKKKYLKLKEKKIKKNFTV